nr:hypothetical protein [Pandoravirus massiliensis]
MDAKLTPPPFLSETTAAANIPAGVCHVPIAARAKVVVLSQKGDRARTVASDIATNGCDPVAFTLHIDERDVLGLLGDDAGGSNDNDHGVGHRRTRRCATSFMEWHDARLPAWLPLPGSIAAALTTLDATRDSISIVAFQEEKAVVASESDLFTGTLPHPLDVRVYTWPVVLAVRAAGTHGPTWLDLDAATCDALLSAWLAGDAGTSARMVHRHDTDAESSALSTDDETVGGDFALAPTTTTDDDGDEVTLRPRCVRAGAVQTGNKRRRHSASDNNGKTGRVAGSLSARYDRNRRDSQPNTTDDDEDAARAPHRRTRTAGRTRRRSSMASDDDDIKGRLNDSGNGADDDANDRSNGAIIAERQKRQRGKTGAARGDHVRSKRHARAGAFEEESDGDTGVLEDADDDDEAAEYDRCDDEIDVGDRDDDVNGDDDIDDGENDDDDDMDADDDAIDDTADCDADEDLADDEDDLMDDDPNAE